MDIDLDLNELIRRLQPYEEINCKTIVVNSFCCLPNSVNLKANCTLMLLAYILCEFLCTRFRNIFSLKFLKHSRQEEQLTSNIKLRPRCPAGYDEG